MCRPARSPNYVPRSLALIVSKILGQLQVALIARCRANCGPMTIRAAGRAVTAEDYERLVRQADSSIARVRALEPESLGAPVRLLLVPEVGEKHGRQPSIDAFALPVGSMAQVGDYLEERRVLGVG